MTQLFSAYSLDSEYEWIAVHNLPFYTAAMHCREYRSRYPKALVAVVPDGANPKPFFALALRCALNASREKRAL